jgi:hypothetical protein
MASKYEFFVSTNAHAPVTKDMRSHAMKTALQRRTLTGAGLGEDLCGSTDSEQTSLLKDDLRGRFRLSTALQTNHRKRRVPAKHRKTSRNIDAEPSISSGKIRAVRRRASQTVDAVEWFGSDFVDPFGTLPIPGNWRVNLLIKHRTWLTCKEPVSQG